MIRAFKLYTGRDGASHVLQGRVAEDHRSSVATIRFAESPPHSKLDWHDAPQLQYVVTLSGTLAFTTRDGEAFTLRPGDVLIATDDAGTGHEWRLVDDAPWRRMYVTFPTGSDEGFIADE